MQRIIAKLNRYFGADWHIAVLDMGIGRWLVAPKTSNLSYLKAENANGRHILIQPGSIAAPYYLLVDDIDVNLLHRQHKDASGRWKPGRMVVETSKGNFQVWIHSRRPLTLEEKRYWLKKLHCDPGADPNNRWGRCPGFRNRKEKHYTIDDGYPLARLIWIDWLNQADIPVVGHHGRSKQQHLSPQPHGGGVCLKTISRSNYDRGDESATDYAYALALLRRGYSRNFVRECIVAERKNWHNHDGGHRAEKYLERTIKKAEQIVQIGT